MSTDVAFVNKFMDAMRSKLNDFVGQVIMLETHNTIANERIDLLEAANKELEHSIELKDTAYALVVNVKEELQDQVDNQLADIENLQHDVDNYMKISNEAVERLNMVHSQIKNEYQSQIESLEQQLAEANDNVRHARIAAENEYKAEVTSLQSQLNTAQHELSVSKKMEANLVKDYQELLASYEALQKENIELKTPIVASKPLRKINTK